MKLLCLSTCLSMILLQAAAAGLSEEYLKQINVFNFNLALTRRADPEQKSKVTRDAEGELKWQIERFGRCFGCGFNSKAIDELACVHIVNVKVKVGNYQRNMKGIFKVDSELCKNKREPPVKSSGPCGPPCETLRLLRQESLGCYCDKDNNKEYQIPKLVCQNNRNKTVDLALCKTLYHSNREFYSATRCPVMGLCQLRPRWRASNWSQCSDSQPLRQWRRVECAAAGRDGVEHKLFESSCTNFTKPITQQFCPRWAVGNVRCNCQTGQAYRRAMCYRYVNGKIDRLPDSDCESWHPRPRNPDRLCKEAEKMRDKCR